MKEERKKRNHAFKKSNKNARDKLLDRNRDQSPSLRSATSLRRSERLSIKQKKDNTVYPLSKKSLYVSTESLSTENMDLNTEEASGGFPGFPNIGHLPTADEILNQRKDTGAVRKEKQTAPPDPQTEAGWKQTVADMVFDAQSETVQTITEEVRKILGEFKIDIREEIGKSQGNDTTQTKKAKGRNGRPPVNTNYQFPNPSNRQVNTNNNQIQESDTTYRFAPQPNASANTNYQFPNPTNMQLPNNNNYHHQRTELNYHSPMQPNPPSQNGRQRDEFEVPVDRRSEANSNRAQNRNCEDVKLYKWGIKYDGISMPVDYFFSVIEMKQPSYPYSFDQIFQHFDQLLTGKAQTFYFQFRLTNPRANYNFLKLAMEEQYGSLDTETDIWKKILLRRQKFGETFDDFYESIKELRLRLKDPRTSVEIISLLRDNVLHEISLALVSFSSNSLSAFVQKCRETDKLIKRNYSFKQKSGRPHVNEVVVEDVEEQVVDLEAFQSYSRNRFNNPPQNNAFNKTKEKREFRCYNCDATDHGWFKCPEKTRILFCYECGEKETNTVECPRCSENRKRSEQSG